MDGPRHSGPTPTKSVDGSPAWRPSAGYLALALAIVAGGIGYGLMPSSTPAAHATASQAGLQVAASGSTPAVPASAVTSSPAPAASAAAATASSPSPAEPQRIARLRDPSGDLTPDIADFVNQGETPTMREVIERLHQAGVTGGLGAFSPPGTRPPLVGLGVPEDFVLPDGYVRHYQATDDGRRIEPILMFSPEHQFLDAAGQPIALPADRVVPPELAPPGLPLRRIVIPAPTDPGRPGR